jgi:5-methylcytosine-specific restriction endonuclease McrA
MSWGNYGRKGWHIDHIRPLSSFKFFDGKGRIIGREVKKAMKLSNLQPLWYADNIRKGDKF